MKTVTLSCDEVEVLARAMALYDNPLVEYNDSLVEQLKLKMINLCFTQSKAGTSNDLRMAQ